jgi:hypothetical protein
MTAGAALGATSTLLRDTSDGNSWTYLLDAVGWLLAVGGAVAEARVSAIMSAFQPENARRRATVLLCLGIVVTLVACVLLSTLGADGIAVGIRAIAAALLIGGIGAGLGGGLSLAVTIGARYAADRLGDLEDS